MSQQSLQMWFASETQISTSMDGSTVILDIASGRYFSLDGVGSTLWQALQRPQSFGDLLNTVLEAYDVETEMAVHDISVLLSRLERAGLVNSN